MICRVAVGVELGAGFCVDVALGSGLCVGVGLDVLVDVAVGGAGLADAVADGSDVSVAVADGSDVSVAVADGRDVSVAVADGGTGVAEGFLVGVADGAGVDPIMLPMTAPESCAMDKATIAIRATNTSVAKLRQARFDFGGVIGG